MPRRSRVHLDGVPLHIVQRGHDRAPCFFGEEDYLSYLRWLGEALAECRCALHAYVLMSNHVHLLLTPKKAEAVPRLVISVGRRYVQYVNRSYRRSGTLWDSRYKSSSIQAHTYLLACQRYIELNPVRAAMVDDPAHYRWSSYRANGLGLADTLLTPHALYRSLGDGDKERRRTIADRPRLSCPGLSAVAAFPHEPREGGCFEIQCDDRLEVVPRKCGQTTCIRNRFRAHNNVVCRLFLVW